MDELESLYDELKDPAERLAEMSPIGDPRTDFEVDHDDSDEEEERVYSCGQDPDPQIP